MTAGVEVEGADRPAQGRAGSDQHPLGCL